MPNAQGIFLGGPHDGRKTPVDRNTVSILIDSSHPPFRQVRYDLVDVTETKLGRKVHRFGFTGYCFPELTTGDTQ